MPYNPHSQGSAERLHQTLKKSLFAVYNEFLTNNDKSEKFDIKSEVLSICNNYNSIKHNATQYPPIKIFFSDNNDLFNKVIDNLKKYQEKISDDDFIVNKKVLLEPKFTKTNKNNNNKLCFLKYKKIKNQTIYEKICVIVV